jgi:hypothetical protein
MPLILLSFLFKKKKLKNFKKRRNFSILNLHFDSNFLYGKFLFSPLQAIFILK